MRKVDKRSIAHKRFKEMKIKLAPKNSDWFIDGSYLKKGLKGFIFGFVDNEWIKSTKDDKYISTLLKSRDKTCFSINRRMKGEIS